jgi:uroporphyrin-III C-methyltransferase / precorrin-2 dehydrogenase / sirohydrochlorin ferrochelatase
MRFLPVFLDLRERRVALVGAGTAAANKLRLLQSAGANVRWYANGAESAKALIAGLPSGQVEVSQVEVSQVEISQVEVSQVEVSQVEVSQVEVSVADPRQADFSEFVAVVSAAGDGLDDEIAARARAHHVPINVVDRADLSTFIFPAIVDRGDVVVAVGTGGASPVLARRLRERIEALLPERVGDLAALMGRFRQRVTQARQGAGTLRRFWERVVDGPIGAAALRGHWRDAEAALMRAIERPDDANAQAGIVFLVGAGPGDADLLTVRALQVLQDADIIFYDELVTAEILDRARRDAKRIPVGRRSGRPGIGQDAINERLAEAARQGLKVVRLKGGDPFIFGRGGEELDYLRHAGIDVVVVPGVTAAMGCAAEAGLPLTFRNEATQLTFISAQHADGDAEIAWSNYADPKTTLVVYMGLGKAASVRDGLIAAGRAPGTPAAVLVRGTRKDSKYLVGRLDEIVVLAARAADGPGLVVVGEAVARSDIWRAAAERALEEIAA